MFSLASMQSRFKRLAGGPFGKVLASVGLGVAMLYGALYALQDKLIYMPRSYSNRYYQQQRQRFAANHELVDIAYRDGAHAQIAYFAPHPHRSDDAPVWVLFGGNAMLAQDWLDIVVQFRQHHPNEAVDFLLIDYPGFGGNQGRPHPDTILSGSRAALDALAASLQQSPSSIHSRLHLLGHSLGCAASLQLAADLWGADSSGEHAHRVVLSAPFTSLEGMVRVMFGRLPGLSSLLQHPFDNIDRVDALLSDSKARVQFFIQHGDQDEIVPVSMGRALSDRIRQRGGQVVYREVPGGDHNSLIYHEMHALFAAMLRKQSAL